jgi:divalent metal cation (Fe/Co/Zn/Cd) transporter
LGGFSGSGFEAGLQELSEPSPEWLRAATSLVGMPFLGIAKQRLAETLGSSATHGEGAQNLLCAYLAGAVFLGLVGNAVFGWWWLYPIAALLVASVAVKERIETWRGEGCCG